MVASTINETRIRFENKKERNGKNEDKIVKREVKKERQVAEFLCVVTIFCESIFELITLNL